MSELHTNTRTYVKLYQKTTYRNTYSFTYSLPYIYRRYAAAHSNDLELELEQKTNIRSYHKITYHNPYPFTYLLPYTYTTYLRYIAACPNANLRVVEEQERMVLSQQGVPKPQRYSEAPMMNLKNLLPVGLDCPDAQDKSLDSNF